MTGAFRWVVAFAAFVALAQAPGTVEAQSRAEREAAARQHFDQGRTLYDQGRFLDAAREFEAAYALEPRPVILFNLGTAYEGALEPGRAADAYERYVSTSDRPDEADVRARIVRLRQLEGNTRTTGTPPQPTGTQTQTTGTPTRTATQMTPTPTTGTTTHAPTQTTGTHTHAPTETTEPPTHTSAAPPIILQPTTTSPPATTMPPASGQPEPSTSTGGSGLGVASALVGVVGLVATGIGIGFGVAALGEKSTLDDNCNARVCPATIEGEPAEDVIDRADSAAVLSTVFGVIGAVAGGAAIVLAIVAATRDGGSGGVAVAPWLSPDAGGVAAEGRF